MSRSLLSPAARRGEENCKLALLMKANRRAQPRSTSSGQAIDVEEEELREELGLLEMYS